MIENNKNNYSTIKRQKTILSFLPKHSTIRSDLNFKKLMIKNEIPLETYPFWQKCEQLTFFNKPMIDIISKETRTTIEKYFIENKTPKKIEYNFSPCDIAIHLRCGDIFLVNHRSYYFMTFKYYINSINEILKKANKSYCLNFNKDKYPKKIWLIAQISLNGVHSSIEENSISYCKDIAIGIKNKLKNHFESYSVELVNNDIINDYNLMVQVPFLICDTSTFCFSPALANIHKNIVFPIEGPWEINKIIGTKLIPESYLFIDGIKNGWQLPSTEISKRNWNNNVEELIHFILNN